MKTPFDEGLKQCLIYAEETNGRIKESKRFSMKMDICAWTALMALTCSMETLFGQCFLMAVSVSAMLWYRSMAMDTNRNLLNHRQYMLERADWWRALRNNYLGHSE